MLSGQMVTPLRCLESRDWNHEPRDSKSLTITLPAKGVRQKESGKKKVTKKVTKASEKMTEKEPKSKTKRSNTFCRPPLWHPDANRIARFETYPSWTYQ